MKIEDKRFNPKKFRYKYTGNFANKLAAFLIKIGVLDTFTKHSCIFVLEDSIILEDPIMMKGDIHPLDDHLAFFKETNLISIYKDEIYEYLINFGYRKYKLDAYFYNIDISNQHTLEEVHNKPTNFDMSFQDVCQSMIATHNEKNADYGNSFTKTFEEFGSIAGVVRLNDKMNRINNLIKGNDPKVKDESIQDTLLDMANYAIMLYLELKNHG